MVMMEGTKMLTGGCMTDTVNIGMAEPKTEIKVQTQRRWGVRIERNDKGLQVGEGLSTQSRFGTDRVRSSTSGIPGSKP